MRRLVISGRLHSLRSGHRRDLIVLARRKSGDAEIERVEQDGERNELSHHEQPHHDLGGRHLDRNLADALSLRRERSDYVAVACVAFSLLVIGSERTHTAEFTAGATFLRQVAGGTPKWRLNARLKAASDS
jgi:hypothetical protein